MEERTQEYLRGRFGDYYRRLARSDQSEGTAREALSTPPGAEAREWGYIPWTRTGTTMVRHQSLLDLTGGGGLAAALADERPRHVYFSAGKYESPGTDSMAEKGWLGSDLVFDLDADHLPGVDPESDTYAEMLADCKDALYRLLDFLEDDFAFEDPVVVFSGGRGYHVHVRTPAVRRLDREERREIVDYVRGIGVEFDALVRREVVSGTAGRSSPAEKRTLPTGGGWGARVHDAVLSFVDELLALPEEDALERLQSFEGVGAGKSKAALHAARTNYDAIAEGNVDVHPAFYGVARRFLSDVVAEQSAPIDEPVTTDVNRLIRLPGSLHGGSGLRVTPIPRDDLDAFDPLRDAVPETFVGHEITVEVTAETTVEFLGDSFTLQAGEQSVPEYVGVFLMARGRAEKGAE